MYTEWWKKWSATQVPSRCETDQIVLVQVILGLTNMLCSYILAGWNLVFVLPLGEHVTSSKQVRLADSWRVRYASVSAEVIAATADSLM